MDDPNRRLEIEEKHSGDKDYYKVTGDDDDLEWVSNRTREPIHEENGYNPTHVDVPERKIDWIRE
jgi:hypothetical protein